MKRLIVPALLLLASPMFALEFKAMPQVKRDKVISQGVAEYNLEYQDGWATINLLDERRNSVGRVETRQDLDGSQLISVERGGETFLIVFNASTGKVELRERDATYVATFDRQAKIFVSDPGVLERFEMHRDAIALAIETIDDVRTQRDAILSEKVGDSKRRVKSLMAIEPGGGCPAYADCDPNMWWYYNWDGSGWDMGGSGWLWNGAGFNGQPSCGGPTVVGDSEGNLMRAIACQKATDDANTKCWNSYCTGCCRLLTCDVWCVTGNYMCVMATVVGQACSAPYP
jgi:hypothetical protein